MISEQYTPGLDTTAVRFMAARRAETHAQFFLPFLTRGQVLLDLGCGPGTITEGLASVVAPGHAIGVDQGAAQLRDAQARADQSQITNLTYTSGSSYAIPLPDSSVDRVFCHALVEHLAEPGRAVAEIRRVLRPGGMAGLCSPDWGGFIVTPPSSRLTAALARYMELQRANGGDPLAGRKLSTLLADAGFGEIRTEVRYERYLDAHAIGGYLAAHLRQAGAQSAAEELTRWASRVTAAFAQAWVSVTGSRV